MKHDDLPTRWKAKITEWIRRCADDSRERFAAQDFSSLCSITIICDDGSTASFRNAILIEAPDLEEVGVFTETYGYHIFPLAGTHVARIEQ